MNTLIRWRGLPWIVFLVLVQVVPAAAQGSAEHKVLRALLAVDVYDLKLDVDTTVDIGGDTRFFSSRFQKYAGGRLTFHSAGKPGKVLSTGANWGFIWGKSKFLMNWEEPGLQSFDPLESSVSHFSMPLGMDVNLNLGRLLTISPFVTARMMYLHMKVTVGDEDFTGNAWKIGFDAGVKAALQLGGFRLAGGVSRTHIMGEDIDFEMDESLTFNSRTNGSSPDYFLGVEF